MRARIATTLFLSSLLAAAGCGPIIGQSMKSSTGPKDFQVRSGEIKDFAAVGTVLVFAPFTKGEKGYSICRGEDEWLLADGFKRAGLFQTQYSFERDSDIAAATLAALRTASPEAVRTRLSLPVAPDAILSGVILERAETVAPTVGVIQELRLRLDLTNLKSHATTSIEIAVKAIHQDAIPMIVREIVGRARR